MIVNDSELLYILDNTNENIKKIALSGKPTLYDRERECIIIRKDGSYIFGNTSEMKEKYEFLFTDLTKTELNRIKTFLSKNGFKSYRA